MTYVPTVGTLFSGVGMPDYAFAQAGWDVRFQVEIDDYCRKVLAKHGPTYFPNAAIYADVREVTGRQLGYVDLLFGGFPCQDISKTGTRAGIQAGTRSGLWSHFARLIGEIRPRIVFVENVAEILRRDGIKVVSDLALLGYDTRWGVISAADLGAPHLRERFWLVAYANGLGHGESSTAEGLHHHEERHDAAREQERRNILHTALGNGAMVHTNSARRITEHAAACREETRLSDGSIGSNGTESRWYEAKPRLGREPDGTAVRVDRRHGLIVNHHWPAPPGVHQFPTEAPRMAPEQWNTNKRLEALGNGLIPGIVYPIALYLKDLLKGAS